MQVQFNSALVCDVRYYDYEGKSYPRALLYSEGRLYTIKPANVTEDDFKQCTGCYVDLVCDMVSYDGKNKFTAVSIKPMLDD